MAGRNGTRRRRDERGASALELVLYTPILFFATFLTIQFALVYLGNQAASSAAREAARVARTTRDAGLATAAGYQFIGNVGTGILNDPQVDVTPVGADEVRVRVIGHAQQLVPFVAPPTVVQEVQGPLEEFRGEG